MSPRIAATARRQRGVVLFISLIMLVALTMAGLAVMRGVGAGVLITRNLVFKQGATVAGDRGIEAARKWLIDNKSGTTLDNTNTSNGYYSDWQSSFDPLTFDWTANGKSVGADASGNTVRYVIHRLCEYANATVDATSPSQKCVAKAGTTTGGSGSSKGDVFAGGGALSGKITAYYRITVRAEGPLNTIAFVQAVLD